MLIQQILLEILKEKAKKKEVISLPMIKTTSRGKTAGVLKGTRELRVVPSKNEAESSKIRKLRVLLTSKLPGRERERNESMPSPF